MKLGSIVAGVLQLGAPVLAYGFKAQLIDIPTEIDELHKEKQVTVINGDNYPGRIQVDLIPLDDKTDEFKVLNTLVDEEYTFSYEDLSIGEYELSINSYDFSFINDRYRITIDGDSVVAREDPLYTNEQGNTSIPVSFEEPLQIQFSQTRQFYDQTSNSIADMILNSPFGYIFKSKLYTFMFTVSMAIIIAPYFLAYFFPDIAEELKEAQAELAGKKKPEAPVAPEAVVGAGAGDTKASGARALEGGARKRRS